MLREFASRAGAKHVVTTAGRTALYPYLRTQKLAPPSSKPTAATASYQLGRPPSDAIPMSVNARSRVAQVTYLVTLPPSMWNTAAPSAACMISRSSTPPLLPRPQMWCSTRIRPSSRSRYSSGTSCCGRGRDSDRWDAGCAGALELAGGGCARVDTQLLVDPCGVAIDRAHA